MDMRPIDSVCRSHRGLFLLRGWLNKQSDQIAQIGVVEVAVVSLVPKRFKEIRQRVPCTDGHGLHSGDIVGPGRLPKLPRSTPNSADRLLGASRPGYNLKMTDVPTHAVVVGPCSSYDAGPAYLDCAGSFCQNQRSASHFARLQSCFKM
jgi:hypothetical protein